MRLKRCAVALALALALMLADGLALIAVTRAFLPRKPPLWATGAFYWALAWPVPVLSRILPGATRRPGPLAIGLAALVDLLVLSLAVELVRRRSGSTRPGASSPGGGRAPV